MREIVMFLSAHCGVTKDRSAKPYVILRRSIRDIDNSNLILKRKIHEKFLNTFIQYSYACSISIFNDPIEQSMRRFYDITYVCNIVRKISKTGMSRYVNHIKQQRVY